MSRIPAAAVATMLQACDRPRPVSVKEEVSYKEMLRIKKILMIFIHMKINMVRPRKWIFEAENRYFAVQWANREGEMGGREGEG